MPRRPPKQPYVSDESLIPEGFVPLASLVDTMTPWGRTFHRAASQAAKDGEIASRKLVRGQGDLKTGAVWVDPRSFEAFKARYERRAAVADEPAIVVEDKSSDVLAAIGRLQASVDRLLEQLA